MARRPAAELVIGGRPVAPGTRETIEIRVARLTTGNWIVLPVVAVHGTRPGRSVFVTAAIHGDEVNGVDVIRLLLRRLDPAQMSGTVLAVPVVNAFGLIQQTRYLPDRRDLNRSFPGSPRGSLAARLAHLLMTEVVSRCRYGIDLHTGSDRRTNLPQVRANLDDGETLRCARAFGAPALLHAALRDGSLRAAATRRGIHLLVYEAGEALRLDPRAIDIGVQGTLQVLAALGVRRLEERRRQRTTFAARSSRWLRSTRSGLIRLEVDLGDRVARGQVVARIADAFQDRTVSLRATAPGVVIGLSTNPLVNQGNAVVHVAEAPGEKGGEGE